MATLEAVLADDLETSLDAYLELVLDQIRVEIPAIMGDRELAEFAAASSRALLREFADVLRFGWTGGLHAPPGALAYARALAAQGIPLADMLRSYRVGQQAVFHRATELTRRADEADPAGAVARIGLLSFRFADAAMSDVAAEYEAALATRLRDAAARGEDVLRALLGGEAVDRAAAEQLLGYRLDGAHQAVVVWGDEEAAPLADTLRAAAAAAGAPAVLVRSGPASVAGWVRDGADWARARDVLAAAGARAAVGTVRRDVAGFARTHAQALLARAVAREVVTAYEDVALAALLTRDADAARAFAAEELGALGEGHAQLRATVAAYFAAGHDASRTAALLGLHRNTVARRLARAEELLGRPLTTRVRELEAALVIAATLDA